MLWFTPVALISIPCASGQLVYTVTVPATANIFAAGQSAAFSGTLPPVITFAAGSIEAIAFGAAGQITLGAGEPYSGPAGIAFPGGTDLTSINGLSGIIALNSGFFLTGVFVDDSVPAGAGPPILNFTDAEGFLTLRPLLFQTFYIGNGVSGAVRKIFFVPPGATRLFLGISDGCVLANGPPGCYNDNEGKFIAEALLYPVAKQPSTN